MPGQQSSHSAEFRLNITAALKQQLGESIGGLARAPLTAENVQAVSREPGVYQLYHQGAFVYVGKADKLRDRLAEHLGSVTGRLNISPADMSFTCLYLDKDLPTLAPERLLIAWHRERGEVPWNGMGVGNHDPGVKRDTTGWKPNHFYRRFPIDLGWQVDCLPSGEVPLGEILTHTKRCLPYVFRYKASDALYRELKITLGVNRASLDEIFEAVAGVLPAGWQITALPGYVIMYDKIAEYPDPLKIYVTT